MRSAFFGASLNYFEADAEAAAGASIEAEAAGAAIEASIEAEAAGAAASGAGAAGAGVASGAAGAAIEASIEAEAAGAEASSFLPHATKAANREMINRDFFMGISLNNSKKKFKTLR